MANSDTFKRVIAEDRNEYVCPLELTQNSSNLRVDQLDECVEADVVGRYSGSITIVG